MNKKKFVRSETQWRDDEDGGRTLWLVTCVAHSNSSDDRINHRSSITFATKTEGGDDYYWDDKTCPADDPSSSGKGYFSSVAMAMPTNSGIYAMPMRMLVQSDYVYANNAPNQAAGFSCGDLVWRGVEVWALDIGTQGNPERYHENGSQYYFYRIQGRLRVPSGYDNILLTYGLRTKPVVLRVESEVSGGGDFVLKTKSSAADFTYCCGYHEFTALNTNFTGKIRMTVASNTSSGDQVPVNYTIPNMTEHVRLFVSDERNLGGRMRSYAWDALFLEQYSELFALGDVTFTDGWNRGIAIGNYGLVNVTNGATLTVWRPLNVNGQLFKVGAGTLALGGNLTFGGEAMSGSPTDGANLLTVAGGYVKPLAAHAFDGLAVTFTNGAAIAIDASSSDEDLKTYGMVNMKESDSPVTLAADQQTLKVRVDFDSQPEMSSSTWQTGVLTLPHEKAVALAAKMSVENPKPFKRWRGKIEVVSRDESRSTIVASYKLTGLSIVVR